MERFPYSFDRVAPLYDATRPISPEALARIVSVVGALAGRGRVLEIGVGTGRLAIPLQKAGIVVVGTDVSGEMVCLGQAKGLENAMLADAHHLPLVEKSVRISLMGRVLHLLRDWRMALREVCRVTEDSYLGVIERESAEPDIESAYVRMVETRGCHTKRPGLYERDLARRFSPDRTVSVGTFSGVETAEHTLEMLNQRIFSSQWSVPESVHRDVIAELTTQHRRMTVATKNEIEISVWEIDRLSRYLDSSSG